MKNIQTFGCIRYFSFMNYFLSVKFDLWIAEILNNLSNVTAIPLDFHKAWSINSGLYSRAQQVQADLSYATSCKKLYQRYKAYG